MKPGSSSPASGTRQITPRPVFCITQDVHNDRAIAEAVSKGRFTHVGTTLDLGTSPDWLGAELPSDEEWRIEWSKFYYGLDLASAFRDTGDARFLRTWERLVASWIHQIGLGSDASDVAARRMQNWTYAWSLFASAPGFPGLREGLGEAISSCIEAHAGYVRARLTPDVHRNHRTLELYSLFIVALAFPTLDGSRELLSFTTSELHRTLDEGFGPDGVHRESSTHYHLVALRSLLGARENARRFELELPDGFDALLERSCEFALHCHRPDGVVSALSDADNASYPEVLKLASSLLDRPDFRYAATAGRQGAPPTRCYVSFPSSGYFVQRSGWGTNGRDYRAERFAIFDCGPLGEGGHGHYDLLSMELYAHGGPLIVDPGRYTYSEEGANLRHWFKGTAAHNTVVVDGKDQTPYRRGRPGKEVAVSTFLGRKSTRGFDVLEGRAQSPCYDALHTRRVFFVGDEYWIVEDVLEAGQEHRYDLRWHLSSTAWQSTELVESRPWPIVVAPGVVLVCVGAGDARIEPGWLAPRYGVKHPAPVVNVSTDGHNARFLTLIAPQAHMRPPPRVRLRQADALTILEVEGSGADGRARDSVAWSTKHVQMSLGSIQCTARAAFLREWPAREPKSFRGLDVTELGSTGDGPKFDSVDSSGCVAWDAGHTLAEAGGTKQ